MDAREGKSILFDFYAYKKKNFKKLEGDYQSWQAVQHVI